MIGFLALVERELYRFIRLAGQTLAPPVIMTSLFIIIFGYSMGEHIANVFGVPYILYILPGVTAMGIITNSYSNSATSLFMARMDRSLDSVLVAPLSSFKIVSAFVIGGIVRGLMVGIITLIVASALTDLRIVSWLLTAYYLFGIATIFSAIGVISALLAEDWDHLATFSNFVLTPLTYLGGVFYAVSSLPPFWFRISQFNPIFYLIGGFRLALLDIHETSPWLTMGVTFFLVASSMAFAIFLFQKKSQV